MAACDVLDRQQEKPTTVQSHRYIQWSKNTSEEKVYVEKIKWIQVEKFGEMSYKQSHAEDEPWKTISFLPKRERPYKLDLKKLAKNPVHAINHKKLKDLMKQKAYIPRADWGFYANITAADEEVSD